MQEKEKLPQLITQGETKDDSYWFDIIVITFCSFIIIMAMYGDLNGSKEASEQSASGSTRESSLPAPSREK